MTVAGVEVRVGRIGRAHGVRGDVLVDVRTDEPERRFAVGTVFDTARGHLTVERTRWQGRRLVAHFREITDRSAAEGWSGIDLELSLKADERPDDPDEYYDHQLVGLTAVTDGGRVVGPVVEVLHLPGQDLLVLDHGGRDVLVPFVTELVPTVDLAAGRVVVSELPGLVAGDDAAGAEVDE